MKKIIIGVIIVLALFAFTNKGMEYWIKSNFQANINSNPNRAYNITYSNFSLNHFYDGITLDKVSIEPLYHKEGNLIRGHVDHAKISGLRLKDLLFHKSLFIDEVTFKKPKFEITLSTDTIKKTSGEGIQSMFGDILSRAKISNFNIKNGSVVLIDPISKMVKGQIKKLNLMARHLETDSLKFKNLIPFQMRNLEITLDSIRLELNDYKHVGLSRFQYNLKEKKIVLNDITLGYSTDWIEVSKRLGVQKDIVELNVKEINIQQFEPSNNFYTQLDIVAPRVLVDELNITLRRNKNIPRPPDTAKSSFQGIINSIPIEILIDSLQISNSSLTYGELGVKKYKSGSIKIETINGNINGITNMTKQQSDIGKINTNIKASLLGNSPINISLHIPYDRPEAFSLDLDVGKMNMKNLNSIVKPLVGIEIVSGQMKQIQFHMNAGRNQSDNRLVFDYDDLNIKISDDNQKDKKKSVLSALVNGAIRRNNLPNQKRHIIAKYQFKRNKYRSPINYIIKGLLHGTKKIVPGKLAQTIMNTTKKKTK